MTMDIPTDKDVYIYGAGRIAEVILFLISEEFSNSGDWLKGCVVTDRVGNPLELLDVKVYTIEEVDLTGEGKHVIIATREKYYASVLNVLQEHGVTNYSRVDISECIQLLTDKWKQFAKERSSTFITNLEINDLNEEELAMFLVRQMRTKSLDFEVNLADHCNLNCQCCNHFSPLAKKTFLDVGLFEADIRQIAKLAGQNIGKLMLLGGEPLLHPDIIEIMRISRIFLPHTTIRIFTNGLLLPKMGKEFWEACRQYHIAIVMTKYPIAFDYAKWMEKGREGGVECAYDYASEIIKTTYRLPIYEKGIFNEYRNFAKCFHANRCVVLKNGRLYTCPLAANVSHLNSYFHTGIPEGNENSISIYEVEKFDNLLEFLKFPIPMCKHCDVYHYEYNIPWKRSRCRKDEWIEEV